MASCVVFLCGFMGSGKTYYSNLLKSNDSSLCWKFIDLDQRIAETHSVSSQKLGELIQDKGWDWFRALEKEFIEELMNQTATESNKNLVCSLGGGSLNQEVIDKIKAISNTWLVWLDVPFEQAYKRIKGGQNRPLVLQKSETELRTLFEQRLELYRQAHLSLTQEKLKILNTPDKLLFALTAQN